MAPEDQVVELSDQEQQVLSAVAELEAAGRPSYLQEVARQAGLGEDDVREVLSALTGRHNLLSEVRPSPGGDVDLGPQYLIRQPA